MSKISGTGLVEGREGEIEKILKDSGFDKLPMTDRARSIIEDAIHKGAEPSTEYTGKIMVERAIPEEPPAFVRPGKLKVGDRVVPLRWMPMGVAGAQFDLMDVPEAGTVRKVYMAPAKVTKESYPPGRVPSDLLKVETVTEDRLWGIELEPVEVGKEAGDGLVPFPILTHDTTLVLRLNPLASPEGEVRD